MDRGKEIQEAYRILGKEATFYDGMITCSTLVGKAVCRLVWNMGREENSRYLSSATAALEKASGAILEVPVGTGVLTLPIYRKMESVDITCLEYSGEMLEKAKRRAPVMDTSAHRGAP